MVENKADDYGWSDGQGPHSCDYITPEILAIVKSFEINKIIDIGCGNGSLCSDLRQICGTVIGVERDKQGAKIATAQNPGLTIYNLGVEDNADQIIGEQGKFDAAVSTEVIEHLYSPHLLPQFAGSLLNEKGLLILTTPYHGYLKNLALSIFNKWDHHHTPLWHGGHIKFWSRKTLSKLLNDNGFDVVAFSGVGRVAFLWKSMVLVARKRPIVSG